jgi:hypothetical protein
LRDSRPATLATRLRGRRRLERPALHGCERLGQPVRRRQPTQGEVPVGFEPIRDAQFEVSDPRVIREPERRKGIDRPVLPRACAHSGKESPLGQDQPPGPIAQPIIEVGIEESKDRFVILDGRGTYRRIRLGSGIGRRIGLNSQVHETGNFRYSTDKRTVFREPFFPISTIFFSLAIAASSFGSRPPSFFIPLFQP